MPTGCARHRWAGALPDPPQVTDDETIVQEHRVVCVGAATQVGYRCMPHSHPPAGPPGPCCHPPACLSPTGIQGGWGANHRPVFKFCIVHLLSLILNHVEGRSAGLAVPRPCGQPLPWLLLQLVAPTQLPGQHWDRRPGSPAALFSLWGPWPLSGCFQVTAPFPLPLLQCLAFPQPASAWTPTSATTRFRAVVADPQPVPRWVGAGVRPWSRVGV